MAIKQQSILNKGYQDKFILVLDTATLLKQFESSNVRDEKFVNLDKMQFSVIGINIPAHIIPQVPMAYMGQTMHVTSQTRQAYPPVKINFTIDNRFENYWFLWKWLYIMNHPLESGMDKHFAVLEKNPHQALNHLAMKDKKPEIANPVYKHIKAKNLYTDYQTTITVYGLDEYNQKVIQFDYRNAFITTLGDISYTYQDTNQLGCSFDFAYGQIDVKLLDVATRNETLANI